MEDKEKQEEIEGELDKEAAEELEEGGEPTIEDLLSIFMRPLTIRFLVLWHMNRPSKKANG